jgi:AcrR family transcriptional regulator
MTGVVVAVQWGCRQHFGHGCCFLFNLTRLRVRLDSDTQPCQDAFMTEVARRYRGVPADERRQQRRRQLLDACLDLVGRDGTPAVTAESVSATAKLTKRYFYESFPDRDAILVTALDELFRDIDAEIRRASLPADGEGRARAIAEALVIALCRDSRRARLYAAAPALPALNARREQAIVAFTEVMASDALTAGLTDDVQRRLVARIVVAGVTDLVTSWLDDNLDVDRATVIDAIITMGRALALA